MSREISNIEKTRRLKFALAGDACNSVYLNLATAGSVLLLFMQCIGLDKGQMGVLLALLGFGPMIAPVTSQLGARFGFKRLALSFTVVRTVLLAGMVGAPWVAARYGTQAAFIYVAAVVVAFGLCRSTADSMGGPWSAEFVPAKVRGKFMAQQTIVGTLCGVAAIATIGHYLGPTSPVGVFQWVFAVAVVFGILPAVFYGRVPGGAPQPGAGIGFGGLLVPLRDPVYRRHLLGHMAINFGWFVAMPFAPLYLKDQIGLPANQVVWLDAVVMLGSLSTCFLWGWAADRYGGKPVMVSLLSLHVLVPVGLILMPRHSPWSHVLAMSLYFTLGAFSVGWGIGFWRYFFINLIVPEHKTAYIAVNTCAAGLITGAGPLVAGIALQKLSWLNGSIGPVQIDQYTPFFVLLFVCVLIATWMMAGLPKAGGVGVRQFAGLFLTGNPWTTATGLVGFRFAGREDKRVAIVERLGASRSRLTVNELIEAMEDPSFSVRYEAIVSAARTVRDPRLTEALIRVLEGADAGLQMAAVWALGRSDDEAAKPALRRLLDSPYRTMRAQVARALGMLGDKPSAERLTVMFRNETDLALRVAYGSAVAAMGRKESLEGLLRLLDDLGTDANTAHQRREITLGIATLMGGNDAALLLWRRMHEEFGDTAGGVLLALRARLSDVRVSALSPATMYELVERCAYAFADSDIEGGVAELLTILVAVKPEAFVPAAQAIIAKTREALARQGAARREYILLAIHALHAGAEPVGTSGGQENQSA